MKRTKITMMLLALAGLAFAGSTAKAQVTISGGAAGDLFMGFYTQSSNAPTGTQDYLVDLGPESNFFGQSGPITLSIGNIGNDLTAVFGSGWQTNSNLYWAIAGASGGAGANGDAAKTLYASAAETTIGTLSNDWKRSVSASQGTPSGLISVGLLNDYNGQTSTANSNVGVVQSITNSNSFAAYMQGGANGYTNPFNYFTTSLGANGASNLLGNFAGGTAGTALDEWKMTPGSSGSGSYIGTFTINDSGSVTFQAVPEPSTYAAFGVGAVLLALTLRRRSNTVQS